VATRESGSQKQAPSSHEDSDARVDDRPSETSHKAADISQEADDLLKDIDEVLRASLGLDKDASGDQFDELARAQVAGYVQKGGQ
jgi:hypothetical protein